jgi:hypothetical protein
LGEPTRNADDSNRRHRFPIDGSSPLLARASSRLLSDFNPGWERGSSAGRPTFAPGIEAKTSMLKSSAA